MSKRHYDYLVGGDKPLSISNAIEINEAGHAYVDALAPYGMHVLIWGHTVPDGMCARFLVHVAGSEKAVIDRDADLLTPVEFKVHTAAVAAAVLEGLQARAGRDCFRRRPRNGSRNLLG